MRHSRSLVTLIETAEAGTPFCACGASMIPAEHDGALWLECAEHDVVPTTLLGRLRSALGIHDRRLLLAREEMAA